ncbi:TRAP transporter substrate-binding protein DctP [Falsiroseomonas sp. HC035]|uniref:TRAP transporter substrate-binding protein DctP n=1 Tax=Falsiroseomonas sp. HC035 TaxID=3390999 RepID=UPI003D3212F4
MPITRRAALAGACMLPGLRPAFAQAARWQAATGFAEGNYHTRNLRSFIDAVAAETQGAVQVQLHANGSLMPQPQIKRGVQTGQAQIGEILLAAYGNEDPFFEADAVPGLVRNLEDARRLANVQAPFIEARLARQGLMLLYLAPWPQVAITANQNLTDPAQLRGLRIRSYSPISSRLASLLGAQPTLIVAPEVPQAFAAGLIQAQLTTAPVAADTAVWDYSRFFIKAAIATSKNAVFVNRRAFESLPEAQRNAVLAAATAAGERGWRLAAEAEAEAEARMAARGVQVVEAPAVVVEAIRAAGHTMIEDWATRAGADGRRMLDQYRAAQG